jgi:hypothetical protein
VYALAQVRTGVESRAGTRFGIVTDGRPLTSWQCSIMRSLASASGLEGDCWILIPSESTLDRVDPFETLGAGGDDDPGRHTIALRLEDKASLQAIRSRNLSFILSFAEPNVARALAEAATWGVWQFFVGGLGCSDSESVGFWEIVDDESCTSAVLGQLQLSERAVRVLKEGRIRSHACLKRITRRRLEAQLAHWPLQVYLELSENSGAALADKPLRRVPPARPRNLRSWFMFGAQGVRRASREIVEQLFLHEQWNIGIIDAPIQSVLDPHVSRRIRWLQRPGPREFFADPCAIEHEGRLFVFCEYMDYRSGRGSIVAFPVDEPDAVAAVDIGPPVHLSYPYVFRAENRLFCIPETQGAKEIALYEVERFPTRWRKIATIVPDAALVDATVFHFDDRWWLAASRPAPKGAESELHLYFSDSISGSWRAHPANPVKLDVQSARPAGAPFWKDGNLYRPAQDCSRTYGGRIVINRVRKLTETTFAEEPCATVEPLAAGTYAAGLHTIAAAGAGTLVDSKRNVFVPDQFREALRSMFKALTARPDPGRQEMQRT